MPRKPILLAILLLAVVVGAVVVWLQRPVPAALTLDLTGTPGLKVAGTVVVDGASSDFSGTLPTSVAVVGRKLEYAIAMQEPNGELRGELSVDGAVYGSSSIAADFGGVKGGYEHTWRGKGGGVMTTQDRQAPP
jgi:hypothetical protein